MVGFKLLSLLFLVYQVTASPPKRGLPGGLTQADENSISIQNYAKFAVGEIGSEYNLVSVTAAQEQVVAGKLYHLDLEVSRSIFGGVAKNMSCKVKVHEMTWLGYLEVTEHCCTLHTAPPQ